MGQAQPYWPSGAAVEERLSRRHHPYRDVAAGIHAAACRFGLCRADPLSQVRQSVFAKSQQYWPAVATAPLFRRCAVPQDTPTRCWRVHQTRLPSAAVAESLQLFSVLIATRHSLRYSGHHHSCCHHSCLLITNRMIYNYVN